MEAAAATVTRCAAALAQPAGADDFYVPAAPRAALRTTIDSLLHAVEDTRITEEEAIATHAPREEDLGPWQSQLGDRPFQLLQGVLHTLRACRIVAQHPAPRRTALASSFRIVAALHQRITNQQWKEISHLADVAANVVPAEEDVGCMHGLDGIDLQFRMGGAQAPAAPLPDAPHPLLQPGATLVRSKGTGLLSDYDPRTLVGAHPTVFPYGTGGCPKGMSAVEHARLLLARAPRHKHARDPELVLHLFNMTQRQLVNQQARVQTKIFKGGDWNGVTSMSNEEAVALGDLLSMPQHSKQAKAIRERLSPAQRLVLRSARAASSRLPGSRGSMTSLRSKVSAGSCLHDVFTFMINVNPQEVDDPVVCKIAGYEYSFASDGAPVMRKGSKERMQMLADDCVAEAEVMALLIKAFADHIFHFPVGAAQQQQRDVPCPMGVIWEWFFKYESAI